MQLLDLPLEVVLHIFAQLDPFKIAKYRRVCRSFNKLLIGHEFSNLVGLVHIGDIPNELLFCFVTPACFGERFLTKVQDHVNSVCPGGVFTKYPVNTLNAIPINPVKAIDEESMFENFPSLASGKRRNFCLAGPLPSTIGSLTQLTSLNLPAHFLHGPIPRSLGDLIQLTILNLANTNVTGPILLELATLVNLKELELQHRALDEEIPESFGNLVNLEILNMSRDKPVTPFRWDKGSEYGTYREMPEQYWWWHLELQQQTVLTTKALIEKGGLPVVTTEKREATMHLLTNLKNLNLSNAHLCDSTPESFGNLVKLEVLDMSNASLTGCIPANFGNLVNCVQLRLQYNNLSGHLPAGIGIHQKRETGKDRGRKPFQCVGPLSDTVILHRKATATTETRIATSPIVIERIIKTHHPTLQGEWVSVDAIPAHELETFRNMNNNAIARRENLARSGSYGAGEFSRDEGVVISMDRVRGAGVVNVSNGTDDSAASVWFRPNVASILSGKTVDSGSDVGSQVSVVRDDSHHV
ncbi:hypothetical protein CcCBS67573_g10444 [Chytriomyces confervae]|uniref:F-box domain-containing protein n=1 Tax=Chytriomyces confervae TaxID=246404 RepID=A0A507CXA3_9FUNG|nr:hypothetical protein CcCBS67573_g10444 [Chytriomyces confervae]